MQRPPRARLSEERASLASAAAPHPRPPNTSPSLTFESASRTGSSACCAVAYFSGNPSPGKTTASQCAFLRHRCEMLRQHPCPSRVVQRARGDRAKMRPKALTCAPQPQPLHSRGLQRHHLRPGGKSTGESCLTHRLSLLPPQHRILYALPKVGVQGGIFRPFKEPMLLSPLASDRQWAGWVSRSTIGRVGYCCRSRHLIEGWLSCSPPLTSLPPHVSRPGWYPAPLGSYSRQLRHTLKHGMDTEELTSHENKRLCAEPAGQDEGWPGPSQGRLIRNSL